MSSAQDAQPRTLIRSDRSYFDQVSIFQFDINFFLLINIQILILILIFDIKHLYLDFDISIWFWHLYLDFNINILICYINIRFWYHYLNFDINIGQLNWDRTVPRCWRSWADHVHITTRPSHSKLASSWQSVENLTCLPNKWIFHSCSCTSWPAPISCW